MNIDKYLVTEAKEVPFDDTEIKALDKVFKRNYNGEKPSQGTYTLDADPSGSGDERLFIDITKIKNWYIVDSVVSDQDGEEYQGTFKFKEKDIKKVIKKIMMRL